MQINTTQRSVRYLCEWLLAVVFQMLRVNVEVIVVDGERLRTFGYVRHKLLNFKEDVGLLTDIKLLHRNVGWGNTIYIQKREGGRPNKHSALSFHLSCWLHGAHLEALLVKSGATLSMVTSRFPKITGSLAIFSGLRKRKYIIVKTLPSSRNGTHTHASIIDVSKHLLFKIDQHFPKYNL